nr:uncharacterized protein LOC113459884 [Zonotrichia albicollis]XP_026652199.1 uncharacterized protein LOC113459884 [Zonotrichia albicollis]XP_026652200.1 uncharacterized protein LOC113459884 [Zonotrichia albicollis]XP_026652201.1 uncharacterized protein LOC113459884 [Zonotrichia albicollis]
MPRSCHHEWRDRKRAGGTPRAAHCSSVCLLALLTPSPSAQVGTSEARAHQWPGHIGGTSVAQGRLWEPWKARRGFALLFAFPNCACGFPGAALAPVSMAGFVRTWSTGGGTKRPQWRCHSAASKAAGGAGRAPQPVPPGTPGPWGQGGGALGWDSRVQPWDTPEERREPQAAAAHRKWCKSWSQMFPLLSFPVVCSQLSTQLGGLLSPSSFPLHSGSLLCPCSSRAGPGNGQNIQNRPGKIRSPHRGLQTQCHQAGQRLQPMPLHHPGHGDRDAATTTREAPISVLLFQVFFLLYSYQLSSPCAA